MVKLKKGDMVRKFETESDFIQQAEIEAKSSGESLESIQNNNSWHDIDASCYIFEKDGWTVSFGG